MMGDWTFFSNYGHVLVSLAQNPEVRLRDVAQQVGITERAVQKIVRDMQDAGFITITKQGRRNRYRINKRRSLRHGLESHCTVGKLLALLTRPQPLAADLPKRKQSTDSTTPAEAGPVVGEPVTEKPGLAKKDSGTRTAPDEKKEKKKTKSERSLIDTRQQGSLF